LFLITVMALAIAAAAAPSPRVTLFTALPLMWGEGDPSDILNGRARRSTMIDGLDVRAIDTVTVPGLGQDVLVVAQPRAMMPEELVALDTWVRAGGRVLIFADPRLEWRSRYPLGDPRRAPPVTLLDPLLTHWGVRLDAGPGSDGRWQRGPCAAVDPVTIDCRIGKGRALLIADADRLDERAGGGPVLRDAVSLLESNRAGAAESSWMMMAGWAAGAVLLLVLAGLWARRVRT
jgi:ABC-type uncharacterized transport system